MQTWINNVLTSNNLVNSPLSIEDLSKLKITKVRYEKIYFKYNEVRYFVRANYDCGDQWYELYKKEFIGNKCEVRQIATSGWTIANIRDLLDFTTRRKRNIVYKHIDKLYFVTKLKENNLIS